MNSINGKKRNVLDPLRRILAAGDWAILDTETTGLEIKDEIVEIAVLHPAAQLFTSPVKPRGAIHLEASRLHGLTADYLAEAPSFADLAPTVRRLLNRRTVIGYNVAFDRRMVWRELERARLPAPSCRWYCLCELVTAHCGSRFPLGRALERYGVVHEGRSHRAESDARAALSLALALAALD